ncbi:MAG: translation initiation factor IF-2 N-terminal domain-containing protein, partial [Candidatus Parcubacteria bacterium]|nr:translation initiation factor IF-2 N-terminal domain-containing protein [Candidatus Parcubacteria bacterium]
MNLTELARKLKVTTKELKEKLPELGFHIGGRAIQIPDNQAQGVIEKWQAMLTQEELKKKEEMLRQREEVLPEKAKSERVARLPQIITVHRLAETLSLPVIKVISELLKQGVVATINDNLDYEIAAIIAETLGWRAEKCESDEVCQITVKEKMKNILGEENKKDLSVRPPVVVVMGHIDHGKTSLLDYIRQTNVAAKEAGAITQHIGAYQAVIEDQEYGQRKITFIDTPGHEAFNEMRSHGGQVADLAILVIAADDKVQPQTLESVKVIQESNLPFIVAINKIDRPEADIDRIKKGLAEINIAPEDWGGKTICVPISAKTGQGVDNLLKMVLLVADLEKDKLLTNPNREALGVVIESHIDRGTGPVATAIIYAGTLRARDQVIIGQAHGRIRLLRNYLNKEVAAAEPGMPVQILGLKNSAHVGDILEAVGDT